MVQTKYLKKFIRKLKNELVHEKFLLFIPPSIEEEIFEKFIRSFSFMEKDRDFTFT